LSSYFKEKAAVPVLKTEITVVGMRRTNHATPLYQQKLALTSPTSGSRSVDVFRSRTIATELLLLLSLLENSGTEYSRNNRSIIVCAVRLLLRKTGD
jgi:hypothetical protein